MRQNKQTTTVRPGLKFELGRAGDTGCTVVRQPVQQSRLAITPWPLRFKGSEGYKEAVRLVHGGQSIAAAARTLGVVEQTLFNWVKADRLGKLTGADSKAVSV